MSGVVRRHLLITAVASIVGLAAAIAGWMRVVDAQEPGGWEFCANENETCAFTGTRQVRYGAAGLYAYRNATDGTACTNAVFGDPAPNMAKHCDSTETLAPPPPPPPPPTDWVFCANENETCAFTGTRDVRYGANGLYTYDTATDGIPCTNTVFGDPAPNTAKHCDSKGTAVTPPSDPTQVGSWSALQDWPEVAVHAALLPTGRVMLYGYSDDPHVFDPSTSTVTATTKIGYNPFCSGLTLLADGRLFLAGGHISNNVGLNHVSTYDPVTSTWSRQPDMNAGRWYPTTTMLADGSVLVVSGDVDNTFGVNRLPQVWKDGNWRDLTDAQIQMDLYPMMVLAPDGRVFNPGPQQRARYIDTSGTGRWTDGASSSVPFRGYGTAVMYEPGKVLLVGGGDPPVASAEKIDLNNSSPQWQSAGAMNMPRRQLNATVLPDGTVLVTGGSSATGFDNAAGAVLNGELWDPSANSFTQLATAPRYRGYHSTALLLPDGRVLSAGGDINSHNAELFSPPYLFKGPRPTVTASPSNITYGQPFVVQTPDAASISAVTLVRLSTVTHANNMNQRFVRLAFSAGAGRLTVTPPSAGEIAPPGHYMLFLLNSAGVPSVAPIVRLSADIVPSPPTAPTNLAASAVSSSQINLTWTDTANNETGFRIERSPDGTTFAEIATVGANVTSYANTGLTAATQYWYRVRAYNSTGASGYAGPASATTLAAAVAPTAPTNLTASAVSSSQINLTWTDTANNETGFRIERSPDGTAFAEIATVGANVTNYANTGLTAATQYWYRVRAYNTTGTSSYAGPTSATTLTATVLLTAPTNLTATAASSNQINISWIDGASNESGFRIERSPDGTTFAEIATVGANVTSYANTGLTASTQYWYRVRAYNATDTSTYAGPASATTLAAAVAPTAPTNLSASAASSSQINLSWIDSASNESGFRIERSPDGTTFAEIATVGANVTAYADVALTAATQYWYRVRAYNTTGTSSYAGPTSATTLAAALPPAPTNLTAMAASTSQINLSWTDNASNESGFRIERSPDGTAFTEIATVGANVTTYANTGLTAATQYWYRVRAYNTTGTSSYAGPASATTLAAALPPAPTNLTATAASTSRINLSWTDTASNESGFRIERSPDGTTFTEIATVGANATSYANNGLAAATQYWYRVRAYNTAGTSSYAGPASATTLAPPPPPAPPTNLTATAASTSRINLSWTDNASNESGFRIERSPDGTAFTEIATVGANATSYTNTGLTAATQYWYRVRAYNTTGTSSYAGPTSATTVAQPPSAPNALIGTRRSDGIALTWTDTSSNETGFAIFRSTDGGKTYTQIATVAQNVSAYVDTSPGTSSVVNYRVRAFNTGGNSAFSNTVKVTNQ